MKINLVALREKYLWLALILLSSQFTFVYFILKAKLVSLKSSAKVVFPASYQKLGSFVHSSFLRGVYWQLCNAKLLPLFLYPSVH
jgi:hypothetical protein